MMMRIIVWLSPLLLLGGWVQGATADGSLAAMRAKHEAAIAQLELRSGVDKDKLDASYLKALAGLKKSYQDAGSLEHLLIVNAEIASIEEAGKPADQKAESDKALAGLRKKFVEANRSLSLSTKNKRLEALRQYGVALTEAKTSLTQSNQLDEAVKVEAERKKVAGEFKRLKATAAKPIAKAVVGEEAFDLPVNKQWPYSTPVKKGETLKITASGRWKVLPRGEVERAG